MPSRSSFVVGGGSLPGDSVEAAALRPSDVRKFGRYLVRKFVTQARAADQPTIRSLIGDHLGIAADELAIVDESWPAYEHVNVQAALDDWLASAGPHRVLGLSDYRHRGSFGLSDLIGQDPAMRFHGPRLGNVTWTTLPTGPDGQTRECLRAAILLVEDGDDRSPNMLWPNDTI